MSPSCFCTSAAPSRAACSPTGFQRTSCSSRWRSQPAYLQKNTHRQTMNTSYSVRRFFQHCVGTCGPAAQLNSTWVLNFLQRCQTYTINQTTQRTTQYYYHQKKSCTICTAGTEIQLSVGGNSLFKLTGGIPAHRFHFFTRRLSLSAALDFLFYHPSSWFAH